MSLAPGVIRDSILDFLAAVDRDASTDEITTAVRKRVGVVSPSSVRSYLNLNTPSVFERTTRGRYRLNCDRQERTAGTQALATTTIGQARLYHADCFAWLATRPPASVSCRGDRPALRRG